jgi:tripartite-type tricarboxylate transporter receptor subunit TctC
MPATATYSRRTMLGMLAVAFAPAGPNLAQSQHAIHLNIPFTAGTGPDLLARILREELRQRWNQPVIVENKPGASGNIGTQEAEHAAACPIRNAVTNAAGLGRPVGAWMHIEDL